MASILRRGDSYSVRFKYKDHAGRICEGWESFKTKKEAQDRKISVEKELLDGTFLIPDAMTVAEMLYKWLPIQSSKHKWAPKTYTHTVAMTQNLVVPYLGKKQIQKVQPYDLEQFYATLSRTPRGLYKQGVKQTLTDKQKRQFLTGAPSGKSTPCSRLLFPMPLSGVCSSSHRFREKPRNRPRKNVPSGTKRPCLLRCRP